MKAEDLHKINSVYLIGIGGIGMSALARYFLVQGKRVAGYDRVSTKLTDDLIREGTEIHFEEDLRYIKENFADPSNLIVIYTPAVPDSHIELQFFRAGGYEVIKRAEMLGILSSGKNSIAVAGTHGKTSISTMIAHLLSTAGIPCNAFLGGISKNYDTNALLSENGEWMVLEADEYDRSFLNFHPRIAIVSSCDPDHLDIYGSFSRMKEAFCEFLGQVDRKGIVLFREGTELECLGKGNNREHTYGIGDTGEIRADNIRRKGSHYLFDVSMPDRSISDVELGIPGKINVENALAAIGLGWILGIDDDRIKLAMSSFTGVKRRFDVQIDREDFVYIDDYAHHPRELEACIASVRENFPGKRITGIFQPHLYSRTRDFAAGFAESLSALDELILMEIYPAREEPIEGVSSRMIFDSVRIKEKLLIEKEQLMPVMSERKPELLLTLGAGDIDQFVDPFVKQYSEIK